MTAPFVDYQNEDIKTPSPDNDLVLMLHDHMQVFTSTVGTQTDPEIFYVNGKPARAVQPFRVVPKPKSVHTVLVQTEEDEEDEETQTEEQPHTSGWQQAQWTTSRQEPVEQEIEIHEVEIQSEQLEIVEQDQGDVQEEEVQESESPETEMQEQVQQELQSQETQTELQHLQRQLLLLKEEEHAAAN